MCTHTVIILYVHDVHTPSHLMKTTANERYRRYLKITFCLKLRVAFVHPHIDVNEEFCCEQYE